MGKKDEDLKTLQTKSEIQVPETKVSKADNKKKIITQYAKEEDNEKILGIIKEIDVAMEADKKKEESNKKTTTTRKRAKSSKTAKSSKVEKNLPKEKPEEVVAAAAEKEKITPKKAKGRKSKAKKPIVVEDVPIVVEVEEKASVTVKDPVVENIVHPWSKLSQSTLNRKTVKELSSFLEEKGA